MQRGGLFSEYFLSEGVKAASDWISISDETVDDARNTIGALLDDFGSRHLPSEANTERDLIDKLLGLLGWQFSVQEKTSRKGRTDVPDYLLFLSGEAKATAMREPVAADRYRHGASIVEAKAWDLNLDKAGNEIGEGAPSTQILRYLGNVEVQSRGAIRFGILTNGRMWRLYDQKARSRLEGFVEIDLKEAVGLIVPAEAPEPGTPENAHADRVLRTFLWLFGRDAFEPDAGGSTRLTRAIAESRNFEARVTDALADTVFVTVFPDLANALAQADPDRPDELDSAYRAELREAALIWLYRLLFVFYAEDRSLLPTRRRADGLWAMRKAVATSLDAGEGLSKQRSNFDRDLRDLWGQINGGDEEIGLPPYNGGLFKADRSPLLARAIIPDASFAPLLDALSRERIGDHPRFINYRDLDVQHLGSVYERLLEFDLVEANGRIVARPHAFARKISGSYYTPEELVMLVLRRTVTPLLEEKRAEFRTASEELKCGRGGKEQRRLKLTELDPAIRMLELRICDPAMGSGHFLVSLVDYLADEVLKATEEAAEWGAWAAYESPLLARLEQLRERIRREAAEHGWTIHETHLADPQLVRRIILKRVIYGVDKNPMAVELAKLSLWLHTFTVGAPLSFLDHHLRCGDSLFGEWVRPAMAFVAQKGGLLQNSIIQAAQNTVRVMEEIEARPDADIAEVRASVENFQTLEEATAPLGAFLSLLHASRWSDPDDRMAAFVFDAWLDGDFGDPVQIATGEASLGEINPESDSIEPDTQQGGQGSHPLLESGRLGAREVRAAAARIIPEARALAAEERFFHWEVAFPGVWRDWASETPSGGFDAVVGNPPWGNMEFEEITWFKVHAPAIAHLPDKAERRQAIERLPSVNPDLYSRYSRAQFRSKRLMSVLRRMPTYSHSFGRKIELAYPFALRADAIQKVDGLVGLLVPTSVTTSQGSSGFFQAIAEQERLLTLLDYQNRRTRQGDLFFDDIDSRYRFSVFAWGGRDRRSEMAEIGFLLTGTDEAYLERSALRINGQAYSGMNPETGGASILTDQRQSNILTRIYGEYRLLGATTSRGQAVWPLRYSQMMNTSNRDIEFLVAGALPASGFYPVEGGLWRRGGETLVPLYEGKMLDFFDHRAAEVEVDEDRLFRPGQPEPVPVSRKADSSFSLSTRYYVNEDERPKYEWEWIPAFKDVTGPRNHRTAVMALCPYWAFNHKTPVWFNLSDDPELPVLFVACFNSFVFDFLVRAKLTSNSLPKFLLHQIPMPTPPDFGRRFGSMTAREIVKRDVLNLTYTAHDMKAFARDMGHVNDRGEAKPPFIWDEADRRQRRARLDALFFHLYGVAKEEADFILQSFPIVKRHDERDHDRFLTRDLILHQMDALAAGDPGAIIDIR
ncbi:MAG TPA: hypothetical protein VGW40_02325 [Allosphingosinicella sp.]|nr:hypothetical protein [Allosphingosinicella sp.]